MSANEIDNNDDAGLAALLRTLPQAGPSAELDAAILADAEAALRAGAAPAMPAAANDAAMPQAGRRRMPGWLSRWKVPLALAASVVVTVNMVGPAWFTSAPQEFPAPAPAPQPALPEPAAVAASEAAAPAPLANVATSSPVARRRAAPEAAPVAAAPEAEAEALSGRLVAAPAPAPQYSERSGRMAAPLAKMAPAGNAQTEEAAPEAPQTWLLKIERLLKAGMQKDALDEWRAFRLAYPDYAVPKELSERIDALQP
ncbi:hypothetical protein [Janthinobacterium fluminis]|uniref:Uncharacterized protein n=1 Tax=Janthinobacterium fluminis TaxID=2987524 RepID=A0ABT5K564_9BURK|nr:hypothetical protein [Janthinobacterium fluminis]MDC8759568.1 hypothetical protein [Janthinobacterium fluminis]